MAMNNLGRVAMVHRGDYSPTYDYKPLDCCYRDGSTYFCKAATTGNAPPNTTYWVLMSTSASTVDRDAAEAAAQAAAGSATAAANQVTLAEEQVTLAQGHSNTASTKATAAAGSASAAADSAGQALASEGNAALSASAAAQSAADAAQSAAIIDMTNYALKTQITNPNILHNWDFRNPVNQRGVSSGTQSSSAEYFYDRWIQGGSVFVSTSYVALDTGEYIEQRIEGIDLAGQTCTFTYLNFNSNYRINTGVFPETAGTYNDYTNNEVTIRFGHGTTYMYIRIIGVRASAAGIRSVKLELGTNSTLHLDPPMDHAVELAKCQRFALPVKGRFSGGQNGTIAYLFVPTPVEMRIVPTYIGADFIDYYAGSGSTLYEASSITITEKSASGIVVSFTAGTSLSRVPITITTVSFAFFANSDL